MRFSHRMRKNVKNYKFISSSSLIRFSNFFREFSEYFAYIGGISEIMSQIFFLQIFKRRENKKKFKFLFFHLRSFFFKY